MEIADEMISDAMRKRALYFRRVLTLVWRSAPGPTIAKAVVLVVQGILPVASLYLTKLLIDAVAAGARSPDPDFAPAFWLVCSMGVVAVVGALCLSASAFLGEAQEYAVTDHVMALLLKNSVAVDLANYETPQYYDTLHRAQQEAGHRPMRIVNDLAQFAQSGVALAALVGLLVSLHWTIAIVLAAAAVPRTVLQLRYSRGLYAWQRRNTPRERQSWYFHWLLTGEAYAKEIRLFDLGALFVGRVMDLRASLRRERLRLAGHRTVGEFVGELVSALAVFGALAYIAHQSLQGVITVGSLMMYYGAFQGGQTYLREVLGSVALLYEDTLFLANLFEFLDTEPRINEPRPARSPPGRLERGIEFRNVSLTYQGSARAVLDGVSLTIRPGEHVALVGANGAGKTTFVKLLCRLYDPTHGAITMDGIDLRELDVAALRRRISVIFQDYSRYDLSVRENIWLGDVQLDPADGKIEDAARAAGLEAMIGNLPRNYETRLGKWFDDEAELSVGEWQKIALARAFVRDAEIVVLDEPTAALDPSAEYEVFSKFRQLAAERTTILISHRLSTVKMADRIFVLANGRISESGCHDELIRRGGEYARLFELQATSYR